MKSPQEIWDYKDFIAYINWKYDIVITPVKRRSECNIPDDCICPHCNAPKDYNIKISHQMVANYAKTAALVIMPFIDNYNY